MKTMYPAQVNSPGTELAAAIDATQDTILIADGSVLPDGPNLLTIGTDEAAETILYIGKTGDELTGVTRGFQGTAQSWVAGTKVARYFTAYDHDSAISNISELSTGLNVARNRLDIEERQDVVLNPGLQMLNAQRHAAFSLSGIKGRTLVNLLGRDGNCENVSRFTPWQATLAAETVNKTQGSQSLKITTTATPGGSGALAGFSVKVGCYYLIVADVKLGSGTSIGAYINGSTSSKGNTNSTDTTKFKTVWKAYSVSTAATVYAVGEVVGPSGSVGYVDAIRIYEITAEEFAALDGMKPEQVAAKYPYVDSVQPVRNPYAIRYGENLLPPFYEWSIHSTAKIADAYTLIQTATGPTQNTGVHIPIRAGETYTLSYSPTEDSNIAYINIQWLDANGGSLGYTPKNTNGQTVIAPEGAVIAHVITGNTSAGTFTFKNPMLTLGSESKPFKPREDSMLALQADLFADPLTGANADEVFEKDGQYFKLAKWKKVTLNGEQAWTPSLESGSGFKLVYYLHDKNVMARSSYGVKYDGKLLPEYEFIRAADKVTVDNLSAYVWISNTDSGWGDNYSPTADEIKAYFMGWKMYDTSGSTASVYNRTDGTFKGWVRRRASDGAYVDGTGALPISMAAEYTPYQLVYQLATPTVEPIVSEGMLTFNEGNNQIGVGTGIVLREKATPVLNGPHYNVNNTNYPLSLLDNKTERIIRFYKNNADDPWSKFTNLAYGNEGLYTLAANFDPSAAYSVTYLMLDTSPIVPFSGSYATNEKAMLQELTDAVQQNATAVSVLMNKKADKDTPAVLITPTLLNGWKQYPLYQTVGYYKDSAGIVHLTGLVQGGLIVSNIFRLVDGFRPKLPLIFPVCASAGANRVDVLTDGHIYFNWAGTWDSAAWISLDGISFAAAQ